MYCPYVFPIVYFFLAGAWKGGLSLFNHHFYVVCLLWGLICEHPLDHFPCLKARRALFIVFMSGHVIRWESIGAWLICNDNFCYKKGSRYSFFFVSPILY